MYSSPGFTSNIITCQSVNNFVPYTAQKRCYFFKRAQFYPRRRTMSLEQVRSGCVHRTFQLCRRSYLRPTRLLTLLTKFVIHVCQGLGILSTMTVPPPPMSIFRPPIATAFPLKRICICDHANRSNQSTYVGGLAKMM